MKKKQVRPWRALEQKILVVNRPISHQYVIIQVTVNCPRGQFSRRRFTRPRHTKGAISM